MFAIPIGQKARIFFGQGFRPFFIGAAAWLVIALVLWLLSVGGDARLPLAIPPPAWHWHEMLFGFVAAAIAGFLLTAVPNWTGRVPIRGTALAALFGLWLAGRLAVVVSGVIGLGLAAAIDIAFLAVLAAVMGREIMVAGNRRNLPVVGVIALLGIANLIFYLEAGDVVDAGGAGRRLAFATILFLITLIGGRIIPAFTGNWLAARDQPRPVAFNRFDAVTVAATGLGLSAWIAVPEHPASGYLLMLCAGLHGLRLARWRGWLTWREPLVLVLHVAYGWLVPGLALLGAAILTPEVPPVAAVHALGAGVMGSMVVAVMTRASLGHGGRELTAGLGTSAIFVLVFVGAGLRVVSAFVAAGPGPLLVLSGLAWGGGYALFVALYGPMMFKAPNP